MAEFIYLIIPSISSRESAKTSSSAHRKRFCTKDFLLIWKMIFFFYKNIIKSQFFSRDMKINSAQK